MPGGGPTILKWKVVPYFRPTTTACIFNKVFIYMLLAQAEPVSEASQPEEQHRFRGGGHLEETCEPETFFIRAAVGYVKMKA